MVNELVALAGFAFVGTVTPGPNNTVLWASGLRFGFQRTLPHVLGTTLGMGTLILGVAAGIGTLLSAVPGAELALKAVGSAYLLYLAFRIAGSRAARRAEVARPLSLWHAFAFQYVNPKAWVFSVAAVGTFLPRSLPWSLGVAVLTAMVMVAAAGTSAVWAAGGAALNRVVESERARRAVSVALAVLMAASVGFIWV